MFEPGVSPTESLRERARAMKAQFVASGTSMSEWARARNFSPSLVQSVLAGMRDCRRGQSHDIAVALGLKIAATAPGLPVSATPESLSAPVAATDDDATELRGFAA